MFIKEIKTATATTDVDVGLSFPKKGILYLKSISISQTEKNF